MAYLRHALQQRRPNCSVQAHTISQPDPERDRTLAATNVSTAHSIFSAIVAHEQTLIRIILSPNRAVLRQSGVGADSPLEVPVYRLRANLL